MYLLINKRFYFFQNLVVLLLRHGADVCVLNGEGKVPRDLSKTQDIQRLLLAAEHNEQRGRELQLLAVAREGNFEAISQMVLRYDKLYIIISNCKTLTDFILVKSCETTEYKLY